MEYEKILRIHLAFGKEGTLHPSRFVAKKRARVGSVAGWRGREEKL